MRVVKRSGQGRPDLEALGRELGSWAAVVRALGKPATTVGSAARLHGLLSPRGTPLPEVLSALRAHR